MLQVTKSLTNSISHAFHWNPLCFTAAAGRQILILHKKVMQQLLYLTFTALHNNKQLSGFEEVANNSIGMHRQICPSDVLADANTDTFLQSSHWWVWKRENCCLFVQMSSLHWFLHSNTHIYLFKLHVYRKWGLKALFFQIRSFS